MFYPSIHNAQHPLSWEHTEIDTRIPHMIEGIFPHQKLVVGFLGIQGYMGICTGATSEMPTERAPSRGFKAIGWMLNAPSPKS